MTTNDEVGGMSTVAAELQQSMRELVGSHDILFITLDTLRYDVASQALSAGITPNLQRLLPGGVWEERHSPASFTYAAHHAFFAGYLPTPVNGTRHTRLFASRFEGSETIDELRTFVFDQSEVVTALAALGYHTACIGGVGFFNKKNALGRVLPELFEESHWSEELGVTSVNSTEKQVEKAVEIVRSLDQRKRLFLFINISALHQPNCIFSVGATSDSPQTQAVALAYVDSQLPALFNALQNRGQCKVIVCSDHGTAYGEDGFRGNRVAHPVVWTVPYADFTIE